MGEYKIAAMKANGLQQNLGSKLSADEKAQLPPVIATTITVWSLVSPPKKIKMEGLIRLLCALVGCRPPSSLTSLAEKIMVSEI